MHECIFYFFHYIVVLNKKAVIWCSWPSTLSALIYTALFHSLRVGLGVRGPPIMSNVHLIQTATPFHYSDVTWAPWRLKSSKTRLCFQQLVSANSKEDAKAANYWPYVRGIQMFGVGSPEKGPVKRKSTFSSHDIIMYMILNCVWCVSTEIRLLVSFSVCTRMSKHSISSIVYVYDLLHCESHDHRISIAWKITTKMWHINFE